jgi:hypothetical protein
MTTISRVILFSKPLRLLRLLVYWVCLFMRMNRQA